MYSFVVLLQMQRLFDAPIDFQLFFFLRRFVGRNLKILSIREEDCFTPACTLRCGSIFRQMLLLVVSLVHNFFFWLLPQFGSHFSDFHRFFRVSSPWSLRHGPRAQLDLVYHTRISMFPCVFLFCTDKNFVTFGDNLLRVY